MSSQKAESEIYLSVEMDRLVSILTTDSSVYRAQIPMVLAGSAQNATRLWLASKGQALEI
jgi:hypothetical protein